MDEALRTRIEAVLGASKVVLFMKGSKNFPQCGFSAQVVAILKHHGVSYEAHNILTDPELRQGLKEYASWPTFPQLYVDGKLVGGCDLVTQLHDTGELPAVLGLTA
jgi:monothiol glutaredoxin